MLILTKTTYLRSILHNTINGNLVFIINHSNYAPLINTIQCFVNVDCDDLVDFFKDKHIKNTFISLSVSGIQLAC